MRERRELLCHYLEVLGEGVAHYSISDWVVNHLLLELIQLAHQEQSVFDAVNHPTQDNLQFPVRLDTLKEELEQEKVFT